MLHVWNGFKLKAFGYVKSLEPKSLIYSTEKKNRCAGQIISLEETYTVLNVICVQLTVM